MSRRPDPLGAHLQSMVASAGGHLERLAARPFYAGALPPHQGPAVALVIAVLGDGPHRGEDLLPCLPRLREWGQARAISVAALTQGDEVWLLPWQTVAALDADEPVAGVIRGAIRVGDRLPFMGGGRESFVGQLASVAGWSGSALRAAGRDMRSAWAEFDALRRQPPETRPRLTEHPVTRRLDAAQQHALAALEASAAAGWSEQRALREALAPMIRWMGAT